MKKPQKITAHTLKRIEKVLKKVNSPIDTFELFFTTLGAIALEPTFHPNKLVNIVFSNAAFESENEAKSVIQEVLEFSNDISFTLMQLEEGNLRNRDIATLGKNLCKLIYDKLTLDTLREKYVMTIMSGLYDSFESKGYDFSTLNSLMRSIKTEYGEFEDLVHSIATMFSMSSICNTKEFMQILSSDGNTIEQFLEDFSATAISTYYMLDLIRKVEHVKEQTFEEAKRNDPCPCGSGKKYKKCCLNKNKNPLSSLSPYKLLYKPKLSKSEVQNYYNCYNKLLTFVYSKYAKAKKRPKKDAIFNIMENGTYFCDLELMNSGEISDIRDYFAKNPQLIDEYLSNEQASLTQIELQTIKSFKNILYDQFIIMEKINNSEILAWSLKKKKIYLVYGLYDPIAEIIPSFPCIASLILLGYGDRIVYDGLMGVNNIEIGDNMLSNLIEEYKNLRDTNGVVLKF
ncbi:SEC-C domain-containing protein [Sulfurimonas sp.]|nr:SEC-C domain-containing protein [Sulfurimonas sp.]